MYGVLAWSGYAECNSLGSNKSKYSNNLVGVYATYGGIAGANGAECSDNIHGYVADRGGVIDITTTKSFKNKECGYVGEMGGLITGGGSESRDNGTYGYLVDSISTVYAPNPIAENNLIGYVSLNGATMLTPNMKGVNKKRFCFPIQYDIDKTLSKTGSLMLDRLNDLDMLNL